jgi:hypothetical protein
MRSIKCGIVTRAVADADAFALSLGVARAQDKTQDKSYVMKITLSTLNDAPHLLAKNFAG